MFSPVARRWLAQPRPLGLVFSRRSLSCSPLRYDSDKLRVAIIGQSLFGLEVYKHLRVLGHEVAGVFTIPDVGGKPDPLGVQSEQDGVPTFKFNRWRAKGKTVSEVFDKYKSVKADLNVLPFCSQFIPMDVINSPKHGSIVYHPSLLPVHRGASAINWTLLEGDVKAGFSIFWADDGLDTGPILLQRSCDVDINDTVDSLYNRFLFPEGIRAMGEAVTLVANGKAPSMPQWEGGATYDLLWQDKDKAEINWNQPTLELHNFIRGNDKLPGAWTIIDNQKITMYGSKYIDNRDSVVGKEVIIPGLSRPAVVNDDGMYIFGSDDKKILVTQLQYEDGKMINASKWGSTDVVVKLELTKEELVMEEKLKSIWAAILNTSIVDNDTDFFKGGAGSMDVVRLVEEVREACDVDITNDDVFMNSRFEEFVQMVVSNSRGGGGIDFEYDACTLNANNRELKFPNQLFINGEFKDAVDGKTYDTINPNDESVICKVASGSKEDVNQAVQAAHDAFYKGPWGQMNARDRGALLHRLADLMDQHKEELATLESVDSGAVYTLALKTHVGMSIETFRYFGGWCDKIQGKVIPINNARPNSNLCMAKREPVGVVGLVIPWNYPLMMLAWKMGACLAAGNTVVLKPAKVTPLTALKFAELTVHAGIPKGVINIVPGPGAVAGQVLSEHPLVRKMGFTGSTEVGKTIMKSAAGSNVKKVSLELGGKSPLIIFSDADMDKAVRLSLQAVFFNKGENCIAAGRLFVEKSIYGQFIFRVVEEVKKMKIGDPLDRSVAHGPQNHRAHLEKLLEYVEIGVKEGARLVYGGKRVKRPGFFMEPTILADVEDHMMVAQEESFGPVMVISPFETGDIDGVIRRANATEYGLASGVFTRDINKALYVSDNIDAGTVFVNTYNKTDVAAPFGGFKQSGFGKDLGEEALNEYLKTKVVTVEY